MRSMSFSIGLMWCALASLAAAQDLDSLTAACNDCHGPDGASSHPDVPTIAGQSAFVLEDAMLAYADEARACVSSDYRHGDTTREATTMCAVSAALSEDEIVALAEHYAGLPFVSADQPFDAELAAQGEKIHDRHCDKCHSEGGSYADDDAGILAGQWTEFLRATIEEYQANTRPMSEKMKDKMDLMSDEDFEALLNYWASQGAGG